MSDVNAKTVERLRNFTKLLEEGETRYCPECEVDTLHVVKVTDPPVWVFQCSKCRAIAGRMTAR